MGIGRYIAALGLGFLIGCTAPQKTEDAYSPNTLNPPVQIGVEDPKTAISKTNYPIGKTTDFEIGYDVDLIGEFDGGFLGHLKTAINKIRENVPKALDAIDLVVTYGVDKKIAVNPLAQAKSNSVKIVGEEKIKGDFVLSDDFSKIGNGKSSEHMRSGPAIVVHEIGHLIFGESGADELYESIRSMNARINEEIEVDVEGSVITTGSRSRLKGYVSLYSGYRISPNVVRRARILGYQRTTEEIENVLKEVEEVDVEQISSDQYRSFVSTKVRPLVSSEDLPHDLDFVDDPETRSPYNELVIELLRDKLEETKDRISLMRDEMEIQGGIWGFNDLFMSPEAEEAAELFAYWITGETYADDDNVVREKLEMVKDFLRNSYGE